MKKQKAQDNNMESKWSNVGDLLNNFRAALEHSTQVLEKIAEQEKEKVERIKQTIEYRKNGKR